MPAANSPLLLLALVLVAVTACAPGTTSAQDTGPAEAVSASPDELRIDGEFGLSVHRSGDSMTVRWMTPEPAAGFLEVTPDGEAPQTFTTPVWGSHSVTLAVPPARPLVLRYGAAEGSGDLHETRIVSHESLSEAPVRVTGVDSLYVIADIHGEYDRMIEVLRNAGLIDADLRWSGGTSHLVSLGDMMSRGDDVAAVLWFLYRLEREAEEAGGRVHLTLGNHEIMVWLNDLRYVQYKEAWLADRYGLGYDRLYDPRHSVLGRWLASKPAILQVDDILLSHAGVSEAYLDFTPESHRDSLAAYMAEDLFYLWADTTHLHDIDEETFYRRVDFFWDSTSVFWYRGYGMAEAAPEELDAVLDRYRASVQVVGHTPIEGIREAYDGRLITVNTLPFADEILFLERSGDGWDRRRIRRSGPAEPLLIGVP